MIASPKFPRGTDPRMGKVGHPADLPCTSYATTLVFLDRFTENTGVNVRGLVKLLDDAVVMAKSQGSRSGVSLERQHHTVLGFVCTFIQRVLCSSLLVAESFDSGHLRSFSDCSTASWFSTLFQQQVAPILLVPHGQTHHNVSLRSVLIVLGVSCPTCGLMGFIPSHCPTTGCYIPREASTSNADFNTLRMETGTISFLHVASLQAIFQSDSYPSLRWNPSSECLQNRRATQKVQRSSWSI